MKFTQSECRHIQMLLNGEDFPQFMQALARFSEETNKNLVMGNHDSGQLFVRQGRTQSLVHLMEAIMKAPERLKQYSEPKG